MLLEHGADPNARNDSGFVPLTYSLNDEDFVMLLLEFKADIKMSDLICSPAILFRHFKFHRVIKIFEEKTRTLCLQQRHEAREAGQLKTCHVCHTNKHCKRCADCFLVWYCGVACQALDWEKHKAHCIESQSQYRPVILVPVKGTDELFFEEACLEHAIPVNNDNPQPNKDHFVVKVQKLAEVSSRLAINNKEMTVAGVLLSEENPTLSRILKGKIEADGVYGYIAFFQATWNFENGLKMNPFVVLPPDIW
jgi:hypothetical protein